MGVVISGRGLPEGRGPLLVSFVFHQPNSTQTCRGRGGERRGRRGKGEGRGRREEGEEEGEGRGKE